MFLKLSPLADLGLLLVEILIYLNAQNISQTYRITLAFSTSNDFSNSSVPLGERQAEKVARCQMGFICHNTSSSCHPVQSGAVVLSTFCVLLTVMPTIEKLLNADWKEKLLDKSTVGAGQLKGQPSDTSTNTLHH